MIQRYRKRLDMYLNQIIIPDHIFDCKNVWCDVHNNSIQFLHDSIINALHKSASDVLKFTKPYKGTQKKLFLDGMIWFYLLKQMHWNGIIFGRSVVVRHLVMFLICANFRGIITTNNLN